MAINMIRTKIPTILWIFLLIYGYPAAAQSEPLSNNDKSSRIYVWASTGPLSYLTDAKITIRDASGKLVIRGKTNHRGIVGFRLKNKKLRDLPLSIVATGGKVRGHKFSAQLKSLTYEVDERKPIIYLDLISTAARHIMGTGMTYTQAMSAVRNTFNIKKWAALDVLRVKNPYVDGDRLNRVIELSGGHGRFVRVLGRLARLGKVIDGLAPPKTRIKNKGNLTTAQLLNEALHPEQAPQHLEANATTQSNSSTLCTTAIPSSENTTANYGYIATASLLEVVGLPLAATDGVTGMLLSSLGYNNTSPTTQALDNIADELDCISTQLASIQYQLNELETLEDYQTLQTELTSANACAAQLQSGWGYYTTLANQADNVGPITTTNPNICVGYSDTGACSSGDIYTWQSEVTSCGSIINDTLFGSSGNEGGSAWAALNTYYQSTYAWYTQTQNQALQAFLSYWSTMLYYQFVLQNEVDNFYGEFANAVTFSGSPGNGATACSYNPPTLDSICPWQSNIQYAFPPDLYSDEIGLINGTSINAFPAGLTLSSPSTTKFNASYLANLYWPEGGAKSWSYDYDASPLVTDAENTFNNKGINPDGNPSAIETYASPQALRTITVSSTTDGISALTSPQTTTSDALTASSFFFSAINQINGWPTSDGFQSGYIGYYVSDSSSKISGSYTNNGYQAWENISVETNGYIPASNPNNEFFCWAISGTTTPCNPAVGDNSYAEPTDTNVQPIMAALMGRTWWPGAANATNTSFYELLPAPLTVPNAPTLTAVTAGTGQIQVAFNPVPASEDGGMEITGYVASCTPSGSTTPITNSGAASPISIEGLLAGTSYTCNIQAQNAGGLSSIPGNCPIASCSVTVSTSTPSAPVGLTATAGNQQLTLAFSAPTDTGGTAITGYQASCTSSVSNSAPGQSTGTASPLVVTGLTGGAEYTCTVAAQNANGLGQSASVTGAPNTTSPSAPLNLATTPGYTQIELTFSPPSVTGGIISGYQASCTSSSSTSSSGQTTGDASPLVVTGLTEDSDYTCTVAAQNSGGLGPTASVSATTLAPTSPSAPNLRSALNNDNEGVAGISLSFDVSSFGADTLTSAYASCVSTNASPSISIISTGNITSEHSTTMSFVGPSLSGSYTYTCSVQVTNSANLTSPVSNAVNTTFD